MTDNVLSGNIASADDLTQIMFDSMPMSAMCFNEKFEPIACSEQTIHLFGLHSKQELLEKFFHELTPEYQPNGKPSKDLALINNKKAYSEGCANFEWMHQKLNGELIPVEVNLVKVKYKDSYILIGYMRDLRELKATLAQMREADERTQIMLDATPLCSNFWDRNLNNIDCNQEAVKLFELSSKQEYLDRFFELSPEFQPCGRLSSEVAQEHIHTAFNEGYCRFEWMHRKLNGEPVPSEITLVRVKHREDYIVVGYTRDLRELKATLAQMREADERTQVMLDATPLCCNLWDKNYINIACNQEAVKLFELSSKQEYLDRFFELSPEFQPCGRLSSEVAQEHIHTAFNEGYCRFEWMHRKLNGEPMPSEITLVRVKHRDEYIVAGYTRDLRELKVMLNDMHKVECDLRLARDAAEESTKAKSEFLANMSHEIRTPMNGILGMLHLISDTTVTDEQKDYLNTIEQSAKNLLRIINDILDFSKIEAGKLEMEIENFNLKDIFTELNNIFSPKVIENGLKFHINMPEDIPVMLVGDSLRFKQILLNLINNSIKFTKEGEISLGIEKIKQDDSQVQFKFSVKDTGIGMTKEEIERLFTPFVQADTSTTRKYGGTGLGLAICKNLVDITGGEIWVESEAGKGSTFYFTTNFEIQKESDSSGASDSVERDVKPSIESKGSEKSDTKNARILLVEDNNINQIIAKKLLERRGYVVDIANNGQEALDMVPEGNYALILMDIQMPIMDGLTATRKLRETGLYDNLPILAMSSHAMIGDKEKSIANGMNDHLTKPINPAVLYSAVENFINSAN